MVSRAQTYELTDLGTLVGSNSCARGINNGGQVVGYGNSPSGTQSFLYQGGAVSECAPGRYACGISPGGQIVGFVDTADGARAFMSDRGKTLEIGTLGGSNSYAFGINRRLQVAGASLIENNSLSHAFFWQDGVIRDLNEILEPEGGNWILVEARGINDSGTIAGRGYWKFQERAFLLDNQGAVGDLGLLPGGSGSYALGLNNSNQVVGAASLGTSRHAVLWQGGLICDLNAQINAPGWELQEACGINDSGQIVGWGLFKGLGRAFMLSPKPSPLPKSMNAVSLLVNATINQTYPGGPNTNLTVTVNHAPILLGGSIQGSLQQLAGENARAKGGFNMTGDWILPGTPEFVLNGNPVPVRIVGGSGSPLPAGYRVEINKVSAVNCFRTQVNPIPLPAVEPPPAPTGTRLVTINKVGQSYGDASTLRDLRLNGNVGIFSVPAGTYGNFTINGGAGLSLGTAGGAKPDAYHFQGLTFNGSSTLRVMGPVVLTVANGFAVSGVVGASNHPAWLQIRLANGGLILNSGSAVHAQVLAPGGEVILNTNSLLTGSLGVDRFTLNAGASVGWGPLTNPAVLTPPVILNQPTSVTVSQGMPAVFTVTVKTNSTPPLFYQWYFNAAAVPGGTNAGLTLLHVQTADAGSYYVRVSNAAGTATSSNATLLVRGAAGGDSLDTDYDGVSDAREIAEGTDPFNPASVPAVRLGCWSFDDTNSWAGSAGQLPLQSSHIVGAPSWNVNGVGIASDSPAILRYRDVETNGNANINLRCGTIRLWFKPDWSNVAAGGSGPGAPGRLIEMGRAGTNGGWWALLFDPHGDSLSLITQTNGAGMTNLTAPVVFSANAWHQVVLTYGPGDSQLYVDGQPLVTNGLPVHCWPNATERAAGFCLGSDAIGDNQARGVFDELETFNCQVAAADIVASYQAAAGLDSDGDEIPNLLESQMRLNPYEYQSPNGLAAGSVMQVFTPLK